MDLLDLDSINSNASSSDDDSCESVPRDTVLSRIVDLIFRQAILPLFSHNDNDDESSIKSSHSQYPLPPNVIQIGSKSFYHSTHCRHLTSIFLVASFCHELLLSNRTTTTREVYYFFVTHFWNQKECDKAIWDLCSLIHVSRSSLGLFASPKGWFCGSLDICNQETGNLVLNGRELDNIHGMPITSNTHRYGRDGNTIIRSDAKCILVIEKEGVYTRLAEDKFFLNYYPCILVTGKGFPDVATRQFVANLVHLLNLPVYGLADCNPYGVSVLHSYHYVQVATQRNNSTTCTTKRNRQSFDIQWIGLRPSQLDGLDLPRNVFQQMTDRDKRQLESLIQETHMFQQRGLNPNARTQELGSFQEKKVELEALNWKGMDFLCRWVYSLLMVHEQEVTQHEEQCAHAGEEVEFDYQSII